MSNINRKFSKIFLYAMVFCLVLFAFLGISGNRAYTYTFAEDVAGEYSQTVGSGTLGSRFSLYQFSDYDNDDGSCFGLTPNVGNQYMTNLCWAFASNTAFESTLYRSGIVDASKQINFSEVDIANYVYSSRGFDSYGAGSFDLAYEYYSSGNGPVNEQSWEKYDKNNTESKISWNSDSALASSYKQQLGSYTPVKSQYSAYEAVCFPSRKTLVSNSKSNGNTTEQTEALVQELRNQIKSHLYNVGGLTATIYISSNPNYYYYDSVENRTPNHMVTIVGWDDNITYNNYKGAYIVQNSYGPNSHNQGYFYVLYDDVNIENDVKGFRRIVTEQSSTKEYNSTENSPYKDRFVDLNANGSASIMSLIYSSTQYISNIFKVDGDISQQISTIKVPTSYVVGDDASLDINNMNFRVYFINLTSSEIKTPETSLKQKFASKTAIKNKYATGNEYTFTCQQNGYYTIELDEKITLNSDYFAIIMEYIDGVSFFINNNSDALISSPTYCSLDNGNNWQTYSFVLNSGTAECVSPMIVSTTAVNSIEYTLQDKTVEYNGQNFMPDLVVTYPTNCQIYYSFDQVNWQQDIDIKDVCYNGDEVSSYKIYVKLQAELFATVIDYCYITITPRSLTIVPNARNKIYGNSDVVFTFNFVGLIENETPNTSGRLSRQSGSNVGDYLITQGNLTILSSSSFNVKNYVVNFDSTVKFSIIKRDLIVTPTYTSKIYGENDGEFTFVFENYVGNEVPNYSDVTLGRVAGEDVNSYNYVIQSSSLSDNSQTGFLARNYNIKLNQDVSFKITPRQLVVTPNQNLGKVYNSGEDGELLFSYSGNVNSQIPGFVGSLARESGEDAGYYEILQGTLALTNNGEFKANNYTIVFTSGVKFFITNGEIEGIVVDDVSCDYDGRLHTISYTYSGEGQLSVEYCLGDSNKSTSPIGLKDVGEYDITFKFDLQNYNTKYITAKLTIRAIALTVVPKANQQKIYGDSNNILFDYSGNVEGEIPCFDGELSIDGNYLVGSYEIKAGDLTLIDGDNFRAGNYYLVFNNDSNIEYKIVKRDLIVVPRSLSKFYGKTDPNLLYSFTNFVEMDRTDINNSNYFSGVLTRASGQNVGNYEITLGSLQISGALIEKYNLTMTSPAVYFEIKPIKLEIAIDNKTCYYGELNFNYTYKISEETSSNYISGDNLLLSFSCLDDGGQPINNLTRKNASGYDINATSANNNYDMTILPAKFYINYRNYDVSFKIFDLESSISVEHFSCANRLPDGMSTNISGYKFLGWKLNLSDENYVDAFSYQVTNDVKFYACFDVVIYNITYVLYGGELQQEIIGTYTVEQQISLPLPQKEGYTFSAYFDNPNFSGQGFDKIARGTTGDKVLYAKYDIITFDITLPTQNDEIFALQANNIANYGDNYYFSVTLNKAYNQSYSTISATATLQGGQVLTAEKSLTQAKANFVVKDVKSSFSLQIDGINKNVYTISFLSFGELVESKTLEHGQSMQADDFPIIPTRENYDQVEPTWECESIDNIESNIQVKAIYTPNVYNITFVLNDKNYQTTVTYGKAVDTKILEDNYKLGLLEYFVFDKSLKGIDADTTINVTVASNIYILYIVLSIIIVFVVALIIISIIKRSKRNKFNWWVFGK